MTKYSNEQEVTQTLYTLMNWDSPPVELELFWGGFMSQWHASPFTLAGVMYHTAEHWMMANKALLFNDQESYDAILKTTSPKAAKQIGREIRGFDEAVWKKIRYTTVVTGNKLKFNAHQDLADLLLATNNKVLVEASPYDRVWGIGLGEGDSRAQDPAQWLGQNLLGFALMSVRDTIRNDRPDPA